MIIVIEGPDGVGKTTLVDALAGAHPGPFIRHSEGPPPVDIPAYLHYSDVIDRLVRAATDPKVLVVADRLHLGEMAYGPVLRGQSRLTYDECAALDMRLVGLGASLILGQLPPSQLKRRLIDRDGGIPDAKSGAKVAHASALAAAFAGANQACGHHWVRTSMTAYPRKLAEDVLRITASMARKAAYLRGRKWYGYLESPLAIRSSSPTWESPPELLEIVAGIREVGALDRCAIVGPGTDPDELAACEVVDADAGTTAALVAQRLMAAIDGEPGGQRAVGVPA